MRRILVPVLALGLALAACGTPDAEKTAASTDTGGVQINLSPDQKRVRADKVAAIAAKVPDAIRADGKLTVGVSGQGSPPLAFRANDDRTIIGVEPDIAQLVADVLGLELDLQPTSWENLFLVVRSGQNDVGFSNITVTEERKDIYDFASYRVDSLGWEVAKKSKITKIDKPADIAGLNVSVGSGTNQEQVLLRWNDQLKKDGLEPAKITYFQGATEYQLALSSGRIDAYFGPNPALAYHAAVSGETKVVGIVPGGGDVPAQIAAMTKKGNAVAAPVAEALNVVIKSGKYKQVLDRWGLSGEAIPTSEVNPPGLPRK
ncbi:ABC transporter substrate-binding protein [Virgisporangium aurantiacum]|uniref:Putative amino acid ABC transporter, substrate-binding protein n=1 Tax=Virgisporangium aurantiacum TaxID=175570 RepID=A0A8J3ZC76_9ACTN|nr:ABC transporter substrate-binding protein [Virgisporangium aurantiacum]GIJ58583.1 putative amino acid ABC transporter, substrate-binding protein [Virgisporangium aurantiacum]